MLRIFHFVASLGGVADIGVLLFGVPVSVPIEGTPGIQSINLQVSLLLLIVDDINNHMKRPALTTIQGAYDYLILLILLLAAVCGVYIVAAYVGIAPGL